MESLSLIETGDSVMRDMLYDGNSAPEKGAVVCRMAPAFIRFGNFEILASRGDTENLRKLTDFTIKYFYPEIIGGTADAYVEFFRQVARRTLTMVMDWQRVGFVHGVMNTDNMSALGLTIDYGPYGWLEGYEPGWTPNTTDRQNKRYQYGQHPTYFLHLIHAAFYTPAELTPEIKGKWNEWATEYADRLSRETQTEEDRRATMNTVNLLSTRPTKETMI